MLNKANNKKLSKGMLTTLVDFLSALMEPIFSAHPLMKLSEFGMLDPLSINKIDLRKLLVDLYKETKNY